MKTVDLFAALAPGCEVWMLADLELSSWTRKIDAYLNFQILRAEPHMKRELSKELQRVMAATQFVAPKIETPNPSPLMVVSKSLLPNETTVVVPVTEGDKSWALACHAIWNDLGRPTVRIFLPDRMAPETFEKAWPEADRSGLIEIVREHSTP